MAEAASCLPLEGRRILVTGGSRGIAKELAIALTKQGAKIALHFSRLVDDRSEFSGAVKSTAKEMSRFGRAPVLIDKDLSRNGTGQDVAHAAKRALGAVDSVILSASVQVERNFVDQTEADIDLQLQVNLKQNIEILKAVLPDMSDSGFGRVLALGSVQDIVPNGRMPIYSVTKAAQRAMIEGLALEYANTGVTLNTLSPGLIESSRNARYRENAEVWEAMQARANPMGRAGKIADLVPLTLHLLSQESGFITGSTFYVTGGAHLPASEKWARS